MRKKAKFRLSDLFVTFVCLSVCIVSVYYFWQDLNKYTIRHDKQSIATIVFKYRVAQRKFSDRVVWERLQQGSPLYNNDIIKTADMAQATITFNEGTVVDLHENTMLQISYSEKGVNVSVNGGLIDVDTTATDKGITVDIGNGSVFNLDSGSRASTGTNSDTGENNIQVKNGNASVTNSKGETESIKSGETLKVSQEGTVQKKAISVTSISSNTHLLNFTTKPIPVELDWQIAEAYKGKNVVVETSTDKDFTNILESYTTVASSSVDIKAPEGKIYYRVYPQENKEEAVEGNILVSKVDKPEITTPKDGTSYDYRKNNPNVSLAWEGNDFIDHYKLEISKTLDFSEPVIVEDIKTNSFNTSNLDEGNYYCRVVPYYRYSDIGYADASEVKSFTVEKRDDILPPLLSSPPDCSTYTLSTSLKNINFLWKSNVDEANYKLLISDKQDFSQVLYTYEVNQTRYLGEYNIKTLPAGDYYWKIERSSAEEEGIASSEVRTFTIEEYVPGQNKLLYPAENYEIEKEKLDRLEFIWKVADEYGKNPESHIQFCAEPAFKENVIEYTSNEAVLKNVNLSEGNYFWRIGVADSESPDEFQYSDVRHISVLGKLESPTIVTPANDSFTLVPENYIQNITWKPVKEADYYRVNIYDTKTNALVYEDKKLTDSKLNVALDVSKNFNEPSTYRVEVQSIVPETEFTIQRLSEVSTVDFSIRQALPVTLVSPKNNETIQGLKAVTEPIQVKWQFTDKPQVSSFILRKQQANGIMKVVMETKNPEQTVKLERLPPGFYDWTVKGFSTNAIPLDAGEYNSFTVTAVPSLNKANLITPQLKGEINSRYLRNNRFIGFEWNKVPDATDYTIVLYYKNENGSLNRIFEQKQYKSTAYKFKNLRALDVGEFEWHVTAYRRAADGFVEQLSEESVGSFTINLQKPKKIKAKAPGQTYGN